MAHKMSQELESLAKSLSKLPGFGPRSARRAVFSLLKQKERLLIPLLTSMEEVLEKVDTCSICGNVDTRNPCLICADVSRNEKLLCVVEEAADIWNIEKTGVFLGKYHVLGGTLRALEGIGPSQLHISALMQRILPNATCNTPAVEEVVLALSTTLEGQTTAHYLLDTLRDLPIQVTSLSQGLPVGGSLDYLDDGTIGTAFRLRR